MKILILNGPNINILGKRDKEIYGNKDYNTLCNEVKQHCNSKNISVEFKQSNIEGELVNILQNSDEFNAVVLNAAAYSHSSIALRDVIECMQIPVVEVHISNVYARESFRQYSMIAPVCKGQITGFGINSYKLAVDALCEEFNNG